MSECDATRRLLPSFLDGELVGAERRAVEAHLEACAECRAVCDDDATFGAAIQQAMPRHPVPPTLRERVSRLRPGASRPRARVAWVAGAAAAALLAVALGLLRGPGAPPVASPASAFVSLAVDSHLRYAGGRLPLEIRSDRPAEVSRWFAGRVPFHLTLPDYPVGPGEAKFYTLEGARLVGFEGDYAALVAYRMDGRTISLLAVSAGRVRPAGGDQVISGGLTFHVDSVAGLKIITWSDNGLTYALVSDVSAGAATSCLVCHGSPSERRKIEGLSSST